MFAAALSHFLLLLTTERAGNCWNWEILFISIPQRPHLPRDGKLVVPEEIHPKDVFSLVSVLLLKVFNSKEYLKIRDDVCKKFRFQASLGISEVCIHPLWQGQDG